MCVFVKGYRRGLYILFSFPSGSQDGSLKVAVTKAASKSKGGVAEDRLMKFLENSGEHDVSAIASTDIVEAKDLTDVTMAFLEPRTDHGPSLEPSSFWMYRGIVRRLQGTQNYFAGILGGSDKSIFDVILVETPEVVKGIAGHPELRARWKEKGYKLMGLVFWGDHDASNYISDLLNLQLEGDTCILLQMKADGTPFAWEVNISSEMDLCPDMKPVAVQMDGKNRKKGEDYTVVPLSQIGVTLADQMHFLAKQALCKQASKAVSESAKLVKQATRCAFRVVKVPPDGKCCWHSISAGLQLDKWKQVPRRASGFAIHPFQEKLEETAAKNLMILACKSEFTSDSDMPQDLESMLRTGTVDITDLHWVGRSLGLSIRCSISDEAWVCFTLHTAFGKVRFLIKTKQKSSS